MKKLLALLFVGFAVCLHGCHVESQEAVRKANEKKATKLMVYTLLNEQIKADKSSIPEEMKIKIFDLDGSTSAKRLVNAYNENAVQAEISLKDKRLLVSGRVDSIGRGIGDYYVSLDGDGFLDYLHASFEKDDLQEIGKLRKGQRVEFICKPKKKIIAATADCQTLETALKEKKGHIEKLVDDAISKGTSGDPSFDRLVNLMYLTAQQLPEKSACFSENHITDACIQDLKTASKKVASEKHEEKKPKNSAMNSTNNPLAMACYKQSIKLLTPNDQDSWVMQSQQIDDLNAEFVATRKGSTAIVKWYSGVGNQALHTCEVRKRSPNGEEVFSRESTLMRNSQDTEFF